MRSLLARQASREYVTKDYTGKEETLLTSSAPLEALRDSTGLEAFGSSGSLGAGAGTGMGSGTGAGALTVFIGEVIGVEEKALDTLADFEMAGGETDTVVVSGEDDIVPVSSEISFGGTALPEKNSPAVSAGSEESAGGYISDWKESDYC